MAKNTKKDSKNRTLYELSSGLWADTDIVDVSIIAPISKSSEVKDIAIEYIKETRSSDNNDTKDDMLPIRLSASGNEPASHILCSISTSSSDMDGMVARLQRERGRGKTFCENVKRDKNTPAALLNNVFAIVECTKNEILTKMSLKEIN